MVKSTDLDPEDTEVNCTLLTFALLPSEVVYLVTGSCF